MHGGDRIDAGAEGFVQLGREDEKGGFVPGDGVAFLFGFCR